MATLSITTAWNETTAFVKREGGLLFPLSFMLLALPVALMEALMPAAPAPNETPEPGLWMLIVPIVMIASIIGNLAISRLALRPGTSVGEAIGHGARRLPVMLAVAIMLAIAGGVLFLILATVVVLLVPGAAASATAGVTNAALGSAVLILMVLIVPVMLFFSARLALMTPVAAAEPGGPFTVLGRSWALTRGHTGKLMAFVFLLGLTYMIVTFVIQSVAGLGIMALAGPPTPGSFSALLITLIMAGANTIITPYLASLIARVYVQLSGETGASVFI